MSWVLLSIVSALFLGIYDLVKKAGVRENAVPPVLFASVLAGALVWLPLAVWSAWFSSSFPMDRFQVQPLSWAAHGLLFGKAALVATSWVFNFFAVKHLPVSVSSPIRATSPLWTILIAVVVLAERPSIVQWGGILLLLVAFYAFSLVGKLEGIHFHRNRWVAFMLTATLVGACSAIYDKYLLQIRGFEPATVQCWFSLYLPVVLSPFVWLWWRGNLGTSRFEWRWWIPLTGLTLLVADFFYFMALENPEALISVVSPLRRCAVLVSLTGGILVFREKHFWPKLACLLLLLIGATLLHLEQM